MRAAVLVPGRLDVFWLNQGLGMNHSTWNDWLNWPPNTAQTGNFTDLGGVFTSPPIAVTSDPGRVDVFGLGADYALYHGYLSGETWSGGWESLGGDLTSPPAALATRTATGNRLDVFALGPDQAMLQISWTGAGWTGWRQLGGCFTTPPVALAGPNGRIDLLGRGPDGFLYRNVSTADVWGEWAIVGGPLLGAPVAASMPAVVRWGHDNQDIFTVGSDGSLWHIAWDGVRWHPWESLAGQFTSEPVAFVTMMSNEVGPSASGNTPPRKEHAAIAISNTHPRFDVFVVGPDLVDPTRQDLWHVWRDRGAWQMENQLNGPMLSLPAIVPSTRSLGDSSSGPNFMAISPKTNGRLSAQTFNLTTVTDHPNGPDFRATATYQFSMDDIFIIDTRARHNDTDLVNASIGVGRWPILQIMQNIGDVNSGAHSPAAVKAGPFTVELCEPLACNYMIANSGNSDKSAFVSRTAAKGLEDWINDLFKNSHALKDDAVAAASLSGSLVGTIVAVAIEELLSIAFTDCDGVVAAESRYFNGRDLQRSLGGLEKISFSTDHPGTDSATGCGGNSYYVVTWSVSRI